MFGSSSKKASKSTGEGGVTRYFGVALIGTALIAMLLQALMYVRVIDETVGTYASLGRTQLFDSRVTRFEVAIVKSERNGRFASADPEYYYELSRQWEAVLRHEGIRYRVIGDSDLALGLDPAFDVVILPRLACLSAGERANIKAHLNRGKGIIATGPLGVREADGQWSGWQFFTEITGLRNPRTARVLDNVYLTFRGLNFFSDKVPAGLTLDLPRQEVTYATAGEPDAYWSDWRNLPALDNSTASQLTLAAHSRSHNGRVAWFGFTETSLGRLNRQRKALDDYMASTVRWLGQQPVSILADWPGRNRAAAVLVDSVVENLQAAESAAKMLGREQVPATFVLSPSQAVAARSMLKSFVEAGEVAAASDAPEALDQPGAARHSEQLRLVRADTSASGAIPVFGFNAPAATLNKDVITALEDTGYRWYFDHTTGGRAVPELTQRVSTGFIRVRQPGITRMFTTAPSDVETISSYNGPAPFGDDLVNVFHQAFRRNLDLGGLHTLFFRSDLLGAPENLHVLQSLVRRMKQEPVWLASAGKIAEWWAARDRVLVESHLVNNHRIRLAITNRGTEMVSGASLRMFLPSRPQKVRVLPAILGRAVPQARLLDRDDVLELDFQALLPQTSYVFLVALDEQ